MSIALKKLVYQEQFKKPKQKNALDMLITGEALLEWECFLA